MNTGIRTQPLPSSLNEAQLLLLRLFDDQTWSEAQLMSLRKTLLHFLTEEMDAEADLVLQQKQTTAQALYEHDSQTSRTQRLAEIRQRK